MLRDTARGGAGRNPMMSYITDAAPQTGEATMRAGLHAEVPLLLTIPFFHLSHLTWTARPSPGNASMQHPLHETKLTVKAPCAHVFTTRLRTLQEGGERRR